MRGGCHESETFCWVDQVTDAMCTKAFYRELFEWEMEPIEQDRKLACMGTKSAGSSNGNIRPPTKQHGGATLHWLLCVTVPSGRRLL